MKIVRNKQGFSLIELMIVVAIIGILATIAVPNFTKFQNKAKQAEARANLSAIYSAHKAFFAEWNAYRGVMADMGYIPEGRINYYLHTGGVGAAPANLPGFTAATTGMGVGCVATNCGAGATQLPNLQLANSHVAGGAVNMVAPFNAFTATANAALTTVANDRWTINQNKVLTNTMPNF